MPVQKRTTAVWSCLLPCLSVFHPLGNNLTLIHVMLHMADHLIIFMSFSGKKNHITVPRHIDSAVDGFHAVADPDIGCGAAGDARFNLIKNGFGVLGAGIVAGQNNKIRIFGRNTRHQRPLQTVPISTAAEDGEYVSEKAVSGLQGWIDCFEKVTLAGALFCGGINDAGEAEHHKEQLEKAYEFGRSLK